MVREDDKVMLDAIIDCAKRGHLTLMTAMRRDGGGTVSLICCELPDEGSVTIVPVGTMIDIANLEADYVLPPGYSRVVHQAADHGLKISIPGVQVPANAD